MGQQWGSSAQEKAGAGNRLLSVLGELSGGAGHLPWEEELGAKWWTRLPPASSPGIAAALGNWSVCSLNWSRPMGNTPQRLPRSLS